MNRATWTWYCEMAKGKSVNTDEWANFKAQIQQSNIPILVEVFDWAQLPASFHIINILKNYVVLKDAKA